MQSFIPLLLNLVIKSNNGLLEFPCLVQEPSGYDALTSDNLKS